MKEDLKKELIDVIVDPLRFVLLATLPFWLLIIIAGTVALGDWLRSTSPRKNDPTRVFQSQVAGGVNAEEGPGPMEELMGGTNDLERIPEGSTSSGADVENNPEEMESGDSLFLCDTGASRRLG